MSKIRLPELKAAVGAPRNLSWDVPEQLLARWNSGLRAAKDGEDNSISVYDMIGIDPWTGEGVTAKRIAAALRSIGERDVIVNVNSPGGDVFEGIAIYNLLRSHPHKVKVRVLGSAFSAASIIAMAGDEIEIGRAAFMMIHNIWTCVCGNRNDLRAAADVMEPMDDALASVYAARTGGDKAEIAELMDKETWMSGDQAVSMGFADQLLPADQVEESDDEQHPASAARRRVEALLQKQGVSRGERRALLRQLAGTPRAAGDTTPGAGVQETVTFLEELTAQQRAAILIN